jgi:hypothetical protein
MPLPKDGLGQLQLAAGEKTTGWVVFEIDRKNDVQSLSYDSIPVALP